MERVWKRVQSAGRRGVFGRCGCENQPCQLHVDQRAKRGGGTKKSRGPQTIVCACQVQPCPVHPVLIRVRRTRPPNSCDCPSETQPCIHSAAAPSRPSSRRVRRCDCTERPCRHSSSAIVSRRRPQGSFSLPTSSSTFPTSSTSLHQNSTVNNVKTVLCECPEDLVCCHVGSDVPCDCDAKPCCHTVKSRRNRRNCDCQSQPCIHMKQQNEGRIKRVKYRVRRAGCAMARCTAELAMLKLHWEVATECAPCKPRALTRRLCRRQQSDNELYRSNSFKFERFERTKDDCPSPSRKPIE